MAMNSSGNTFLTFMSALGGTGLGILFTETDASSPTRGVFATVQTISSGTDNGNPRIGISSNSTTVNAASVWLQNNGTHNIVQAVTGSRNVIGAPTSPAVIQNVTNFGVYNDYYNTLTWTASTDPTVVGYNIFRNNAFVNTVDASTLSYVDHNQIQSGSVVYSIRSINADLLQSAAATVSYP
jgi:hypothetical protein